MPDIVIPIVFPDYRIAVRTPRTQVDLLPFTDIDNFTIPEYKNRFSNLGHAGVLFINGKNGLTKYYEYGRYDPPKNIGIVKKIRNLPDARVKDGEIDVASLKKPLAKISRVSGQSGPIQGVFIQVENKFQAMLNYADKRKMQNGNPKRKPYELMSNSCIHFAKAVVQQADVDTPWMIDPRPNSYIGEFRDDYPDLDYKNGKLTIEDIGTF